MAGAVAFCEVFCDWKASRMGDDDDLDSTRGPSANAASAGST